MQNLSNLVLNRPTDDKSVSVQVMTSSQTENKPLPEQIGTQYIHTYIQHGASTRQVHFLERRWTLFQISLNFFTWGQAQTKTSLVQLMAWAERAKSCRLNLKDYRHILTTQEMGSLKLKYHMLYIWRYFLGLQWTYMANVFPLIFGSHTWTWLNIPAEFRYAQVRQIQRFT